MNIPYLWAFLDTIGFHVIKLLISLFWQSSILIGLFAIIVYALRERSAAVKHFLWASMLCLLPVIPILGLIVSVLGTPQYEIPVIPEHISPLSLAIEVTETYKVTENEQPKSLSGNNSESLYPSFTLADYPWAFTFILYTAGVLFFLSIIAIWVFRIRRWKNRGAVVTERRIINAFQAARDQFSLRRKFLVMENSNIHAPVTIGMFHPVVLIPPGFTDNLSDADLQSIAIHEISHIKRNDVLVLTLISYVRALFFFHPLVWLVARQVLTLAENACDDAVLESVEDPVKYAEMLTRVAVNLRKNMFIEEIAVGFIFSKHAFLRRVEEILSGPKDQIRKLSRTALAGISVVVGVSLIVVLVVPLGVVNEANSEQPKMRPTMQLDYLDYSVDTITEFINGEAQIIDPHELAGVVYNETGKPLEGVLVDAWYYNSEPGQQVYTDEKGRFKIKNLSGERKVQLTISKANYSSELIRQQETGIGKIIIRLGNKTYFEGNVLAPDGSPVPDALIRANPGIKYMDGFASEHIWYETRNKKDGSYRLYVAADKYDIQVDVPDVGVARMQNETIVYKQSKRLDIILRHGITFQVKIFDIQTGQPVEGVKLISWSFKEGARETVTEGISNKSGFIEIKDKLPGPFKIQVEADGYTRCWPEEAMHIHQQLMVSEKTGWQHKLNKLEFDLKPGMEQVAIVIEKGVRITGKVIDPDGNPVGGATVAPARTGTGNSITGDTRFSVLSNDDGTFEMLLPASGEAEYNLVAHDGDFQEWRTWANGVMEPIKTRPGQVIRNVTMRLSRPSTVRGTIKDPDGNPMANHWVRAHPADMKGNRYYDPRIRTDDNGNYTLQYIREGEHYIIGGEMLMSFEYAPDGHVINVTLKAGEVKDGKNLVGYTKETLRLAMKRPSRPK